MRKRFFFFFEGVANFSKTYRTYPSSYDRETSTIVNVALTMNPLAIFPSLVPDGQKAWLSGGFSARVFFFYVQRR